MWQLHFFMKKPAAATPRSSSRMALPSTLHKRHKGGPLTSYCEIATSLLESYFTDDVIAETDAKIKRYTQSMNKTAIEHAEHL